MSTKAFLLFFLVLCCGMIFVMTILQNVYGHITVLDGKVEDNFRVIQAAAKGSSSTAVELETLSASWQDVKAKTEKHKDFLSQQEQRIAKVSESQRKTSVELTKMKESIELLRQQLSSFQREQSQKVSVNRAEIMQAETESAQSHDDMIFQINELLKKHKTLEEKVDSEMARRSMQGFGARVDDNAGANNALSSSSQSSLEIVPSSRTKLGGSSSVGSVAAEPSSTLQPSELASGSPEAVGSVEAEPMRTTPAKAVSPQADASKPQAEAFSPQAEASWPEPEASRTQPEVDVKLPWPGSGDSQLPRPGGSDSQLRFPGSSDARWPQSGGGNDRQDSINNVEPEVGIQGDRGGLLGDGNFDIDKEQKSLESLDRSFNGENVDDPLVN
eukprot:TRINITY_DN15599_c0_g1_i1.p1 TRINITY_DN15599_c0_g1~~TRINITY_DN15599_c0_g1_i1.p1  ORF type:complete len:386 (-),score=95.93 TRINITY_DN15599_c0_g1_i1:82-1239(-)